MASGSWQKQEMTDYVRYRFRDLCFPGSMVPGRSKILSGIGNAIRCKLGNSTVQSDVYFSERIHSVDEDSL